MKIIILFFVFLLFQSQKITVTSEKNLEPISDANISIFKNGTIIKNGKTNQKGIFYLKSEYDSILIASIGYLDKILLKNNVSNIKISLEKDPNFLKEVIVENNNKKLILGNYQKTSSFNRVISKTENFGIFFNSRDIGNFKINSLYLNLKNVPNKIDLIFNFYETDSINRIYINQKTQNKLILKEFIPNINKKIATFEYELKPEKNNKIIEVSLNSLNLDLPKTGIFISVYSKNIYDNQDKNIPTTSFTQLPFLNFHKTNENNYCVKLPFGINKWQNQNLISRDFEDNDDEKYLFPTHYYEPSIGLKIKLTNE